MKSTTVLSAIFLVVAVSGPCAFGQHQGYIDIDLRNGDTVSLSPTKQANHFKDRKGDKVVRTGTSSNRQENKWESGKRGYNDDLNARSREIARRQR